MDGRYFDHLCNFTQVADVVFGEWFSPQIIGGESQNHDWDEAGDRSCLICRRLPAHNGV